MRLTACLAFFPLGASLLLAAFAPPPRFFLPLPPPPFFLPPPPAALEPEREYAHQNELSVKTLTRPLKSVSQSGMRVAVMVFACPLQTNTRPIYDLY